MLSAHIVTLASMFIVLVASGCGGSSNTGTTTSASTSVTQATAQPTSSPTATKNSTAQSKTALVAIASGTPLIRSEWIKKGEAICSKLNAQLAANTAKSSSELARVLPLASAYEHSEFVALARLVPPTTMSKDWQQFLTKTEEWSANSLKIAQATSPSQFDINTPLVATTKSIHEHLAAIAKRDGFKECALV